MTVFLYAMYAVLVCLYRAILQEKKKKKQDQARYCDIFLRMAADDQVFLFNTAQRSTCQKHM